MRILAKLLSAFMVSVILVIAIGITAYTELNAINEEFNVLKEERLKELRLMGDMKQHVHKGRTTLADYIATSDPTILKDIHVHHSKFEERLTEFKKIPGGTASTYDLDVAEMETKVGLIYDLESDLVNIHLQRLKNEALLRNDTLKLHDMYHEMDEVIYEMQQAASQSKANVTLNRVVRNLSFHSLHSVEHINTYVITGGEPEKAVYEESIEDFKETLTAYRDGGGDSVLYARANATLGNLTTIADDVFDHYSENVRLKTLEEQVLLNVIKLDGDVNTILDGLISFVDERLDKATLKVSENVNDAISMIFHFTILMASLNVILGVGLSINITKPVKRLIKGTEKIKKGDFDFRIEMTSRDEIGDLSDSFNKMAENLKIAEDLKAHLVEIKKAREDLEKEVETRKLAERQVRMLTSRLETIIRKQRHELEKKSKGRKKG